MFHKTALAALALATMTAVTASAQQVQVGADYQMRSDFTDQDDHELGRGEMVRYGLKYNQPLSLKVNENGLPTVWALSLNSQYARLIDYGQARRLNPSSLLNATLSLSHIRPIADRWSIIASLGVGIYARADHVRWNTTLANGACIFAYQVRPGLSVGVGAGLTNAYGVPMVMPMAYLDWKLHGKWEVEVNFVNMIRASVAMRPTRKWRVGWNVLEMDAMLAVVPIEGRYKIYNSMMIKSYLTSSWYLTPKLSFYANAGIDMVRSSKLSRRRLGSMFSFGGHKCHFKPAPIFSVGARWGF